MNAYIETPRQVARRRKERLDAVSDNLINEIKTALNSGNSVRHGAALLLHDGLGDKRIIVGSTLFTMLYDLMLGKTCVVARES